MESNQLTDRMKYLAERYAREAALEDLEKHCEEKAKEVYKKTIEEQESELEYWWITYCEMTFGDDKSIPTGQSYHHQLWKGTMADWLIDAVGRHGNFFYVVSYFPLTYEEMIKIDKVLP